MNARRATRPFVDVDAFDKLIAAYGGIQSFALEIEHDRKSVWSWRTDRHAPAPIVQRAINQRALRHKIAPPYPEAVTTPRSLAYQTIRRDVIDEAIGELTGRDMGEAILVLERLKTREAI